MARAVPEDRVARVAPAATSDPEVGSCRIKAQMLPDDFRRMLSGVQGFKKMFDVHFCFSKPSTVPRRKNKLALMPSQGAC